MKLTQKFLLAGAIVTFASTSPSWADGKEGGADPAPAIEEPSGTPDDQIVVDDGQIIVDDGQAVDGHEGEVTDGGHCDDCEHVNVVCDRTVDGGPVEKGEVTEGEPIELVDPVVYDLGGPAVQRGDDKNLNPDVIFQTTALGGGESTTTGKSEAGFGSDERAADIQTKGSGVSSVKSQKKGPVALVKKGRVFLR